MEILKSENSKIRSVGWEYVFIYTGMKVWNENQNPIYVFTLS